MVAGTELEQNSTMEQDKQDTEAKSLCRKRAKPATKVESLCCRKRKESIKKKTMELSVLCDIKACIVVVEPSGQIETWPRNPDDVREIITMYKDLGAKSGCRSKRVFESSVKVEKAVDNVAKKAKVDGDFGFSNGCRKQEEAWDNGLSKAFAEDIVKGIDSKLEILGKKKGLLDENKGKEAALHEEYFTDSWNMPKEEEASDSRGIGKPQLDAASEQMVPCLGTMSKQNMFENPQIFGNSSGNSELGLMQGASANQEIVQNIPLQFNFNSSSNFDHGINLSFSGLHNVQFPHIQFPHVQFPHMQFPHVQFPHMQFPHVQFPHQFPWFDTSNYQTGMLSVMPELQGVYFPEVPLIQGMNLSGAPSLKGMDFSAGPSMQSTTLMPQWFDGGSLPQLCPLPQQASGPEYHSWQPFN